MECNIVTYHPLSRSYSCSKLIASLLVAEEGLVLLGAPHEREITYYQVSLYLKTGTPPKHVSFQPAKSLPQDYRGSPEPSPSTGTLKPSVSMFLLQLRGFELAFPFPSFDVPLICYICFYASNSYNLEAPSTFIHQTEYLRGG